MEHEHWSSGQAKKAGQKFRREARRIFDEYQKTLFKKLEEVRIIIRPRPRWIPRAVWTWCAGIFVDLNNANKALVFETPSDFLTRKHKESVAQKEHEHAASEYELLEDSVLEFEGDSGDAYSLILKMKAALEKELSTE